MQSNDEENISEEIPIELLQRGVKISDKEVLQQDYFILEVKFKYKLGTRRKFIKWREIRDKCERINSSTSRRTRRDVLFRKWREKSRSKINSNANKGSLLKRFYIEHRSIIFTNIKKSPRLLNLLPQ